MSESLKEQVARLQSQVDEYRQREQDALLARLKQAETDRDHFRQEALRLDQVARDLDSAYKDKIARLEREIERLNNARKITRSPVVARG